MSSDDANPLPDAPPRGEMLSEGDDMMPNMENFMMPTREELLASLDSMGLKDEEKEEILAALTAKSPLAQSSPWTSQGLILVFFLLIVISIFAFFGYKLYKSLKDKEVKREEKKKLKQMKKKK